MIRPAHCFKAAALLSLGLTVLAVTARAQVFSTPKILSNNPGFSFAPQIAVDASGNINVVWEDGASGLSILFSRSADGGATFSNPKKLSNNPGGSETPRIAVDAKGNINVVWKAFIPGNPDIFFTPSTDGGATFSTPKNLSNSSGFSDFPQIAVDGSGNVNVVWEDDTPGNLDIFYSRSTDGGTTFSAPINLSNNPAVSEQPRMVVDASDNINVVWADNTPPDTNPDIFFTRSTDGGATFSTPKNVSNNSGFSFNAQIVADASGNIDVVWDDNTAGNRDIFFSRSTDGGATFSRSKNLSNNTGFSSEPLISVDVSGNINVVWQDTTPGNVDIFFSRSTDGGATFSIPKNISNDTGESAAPEFAEDQRGNINVVWRDNTPGSRDIFFSRSTDGGATFSAPKNLSSNAGSSSSSSPQVAVDSSGNVNVVWQTFTSAPTNLVIFFSRGGVNQPPVANAGPDQTVQCASHTGTPVTLDGSKSSDPDGDVLSFVWKDAANNVVGTTAVVNLALPLGTQTFTLTVTDPGGLSSTATTHVNVVDTTPPTLRVSLSPNVLWPPNHSLVQVTATIEVTDTCDPNPTVELVSITSNEPDNGLGDGDTPNDIQGAVIGTDDQSFFLRAERSGTGTGRIYTVTYRAKDASGNTTLATAQVRVPHDQD